MKKNPFTNLRVSIGGAMGNSYSIELKGNVIVYEILSCYYQPKSIEEIRPSDARWNNFISCFKKQGVLKWKSEYRASEKICDGTHWSVKVLFDGQVFSSSGSNAYPDGFDGFLLEVSKFIGGRVFE